MIWWRTTSVETDSQLKYQTNSFCVLTKPSQKTVMPQQLTLTEIMKHPCTVDISINTSYARHGEIAADTDRSGLKH